jgi:hypothetical protein
VSVGPQPSLKYLPYGAVKKKRSAKTTGAEMKITQRESVMSIGCLRTISVDASPDNGSGDGICP